MKEEEKTLVHIFADYGVHVQEVGPFAAVQNKEGQEILLPIQAKPNAKKERLEILPQGILKVHIHAAPVEGSANKAIAQFLAEHLGLPPSQVILWRGDKGKFKKFHLRYLFSKNKPLSYYKEKLHSFLRSALIHE